VVAFVDVVCVSVPPVVVVLVDPNVTNTVVVTVLF